MVYIGKQLEKDVIVVETAYSYRRITHKGKYQDIEYPQTVEGQRDFLEKLTRTVLATPGNHGQGICYWHPESIQVNDHGIWKDGAAELFDETDSTLPAIATIAETLAKEGK